MKLLTVVFYICIASSAYTQLPNKNTYLIANLNMHPGYSGLWGYVAPDNSEYALLGCINGTSFVNVTDSSNVYESDFISGGDSQWREIKTYSHYAYIVSEASNSRLQIVDLQYLPDSVSLISTFSYPGFTKAHAISQSGSYLYLSGGTVCPNGGVQILDVINPILPVVRGFNSTRYVHDCRVLNDTIWTLNILNQRISIINATDKNNLQEIRSFTSLSPLPHNCAITSDRKYLFVTHESEDPAGNLEIWNIEDLENITFIRNWQPTGISTSVTHNVEIYGNYAFVAHYTAGMRILDITNAAEPVEIAWYDTRPQDNLNIFEGCWAVYRFESGKIIASDISNGLFVLKATYPTSISSNQNTIADKFLLSQNYPNPFNPVTNIKYIVPENNKGNSVNVKLIVLDNLGKEISTLVNESKKSGVYKTEFSAISEGREFPSGIYFYKLVISGISGEYSEIKKMILIK